MQNKQGREAEGHSLSLISSPNAEDDAEINWLKNLRVHHEMRLKEIEETASCWNAFHERYESRLKAEVKHFELAAEQISDELGRRARMEEENLKLRKKNKLLRHQISGLSQRVHKAETEECERTRQANEWLQKQQRARNRLRQQQAQLQQIEDILSRGLRHVTIADEKVNNLAKK